MTEAEWLTCADPQPMLEFIHPKLSARKERLFACACCRGKWGFLPHIHSRQAVETAECFADGLISEHYLERAARRARKVGSTDSARLATLVAQAQLAGTIQEAIRMRGVRIAVSVLRELFNPFHSPLPLSSSILAWNDSTIIHIAQATYDNRAFDRLPILADALEDAGCDNADILAHCRGRNEHVRGCWVVDLLLGKT